MISISAPWIYLCEKIKLIFDQGEGTGLLLIRPEMSDFSDDGIAAVVAGIVRSLQWPGRWYGPTGQVVQNDRAGSTKRQGRRYGPRGQAVRTDRASGIDRQGRRYGLTGQAARTDRAGGTDQ
jgi:hypothetical protein